MSTHDTPRYAIPSNPYPDIHAIERIIEARDCQTVAGRRAAAWAILDHLAGEPVIPNDSGEAS